MGEAGSSLPKHFSAARLAPPMKADLYGRGGAEEFCVWLLQPGLLPYPYTLPSSTAHPLAVPLNCLTPPLPCLAGLLNLLRRRPPAQAFLWTVLSFRLLGLVLLTPLARFPREADQQKHAYSRWMNRWVGR